MGTLYFAARGMYSSVPMTAQTWPAARKPFTFERGDDMMASMAGGTSTWDTRMEKFFKPRLWAWLTAMALEGAVVSKPTAKKTTSLSGFSSATASESRGE